ncbi:hypothetical protein [Legionella brunensis]|uniref:Uncharacterized protein n=1 Tax=Legionella brunensis TaxID=29422 RepID=A0A0W0S4Q7_9GAMM|nr:hypothetical protein [Legionella brunensis]KTC78041.1 hypothetical protein Lbru_2333 [Legionella brunensis]
MEAPYEVQQPREYLVIACGKTCESHPDSRWVSIDLDPEKKPDIAKKLEEVSKADLESVNHSFSQFKIILVEAISGGVNLSRFKSIMEFMKQDGALIVEPGDRYLFENYRVEKIPINAFILSRDIVAIAHGQQSLDEVVSIMKKDLKIENERYSRIHEWYSKLGKMPKYDKLEPMLLSILAHIHAYKDERDHRFFRNYFKDNQYDLFVQNMDELILKLSDKEITIDIIQDKMLYWRQLLPSSTKQSHELDYDTLNVVIDICHMALKYYAEASPRTKQLLNLG